MGVALSASVLVAGCVIPIGPSFEDAEPLMSPHIDSSRIPIGQIVSPEPDGTLPLFEVSISDPNVHDDIYVRVVFNYPPFERAITRVRDVDFLPPAEDGSARRGSYRWRPTCLTDVLPSILTQHRMMLVVSDRPFKETSNPDEVFTAVRDDAHVTRAQWILNVECK